jgi:hypothetical protein
MDPNGGRPPRINQWNIGIQRELTPDLVVEAAWVGNRGTWLQANNLDDINGLTAQKLAAVGLNPNDANARTLLASTFASGKPQAEVAADMERDFFMSAQEALDYGLVDRLLERRKHGEAEAK